MEGMEIFFDYRVISFIAGLLVPLLLYWNSIKTHGYWKKRGIPYAKPQTLFGKSEEKPVQELEVDRYKNLGKIYGHFDTSFSAKEPALSVGDPELLRDILVKDFSFFPNRRDVGSMDSIISKMVSSMKGEDWKRVRSIVSPTFSTGKIKRVMGIFKDCSKTLLQNFKMGAVKSDNIEVKRLYGAFTMDVIASSAFSTKIDSHNDPDNEFMKAARGIFAQPSRFAIALFLHMPRFVLKIIGKMSSTRSNLEFFKVVALQIIEERKRTGQTRNDFLQLLLDAATQTSKDDKEDDKGSDIASNYSDDASSHAVFKTVTSKRMSIDELVAQCVVFFLAGYLTTSSTLSYASYLLALNQDKQEKVYQEIKETLSQTNGELTYEAVQKMKYLDNVISETLRLYPPAPRLERISETNYKLKDAGITIPKGMTVNVPIYAMHRDPELFQDPDSFNPDRFTPEERAKMVPYSYMPFGAGPRNCVGMRFALMEIKVCLVYVLSAFHIHTSPETKVPLEFNNGKNILSPKDIVLRMKARNECPLKEFKE